MSFACIVFIHFEYMPTVDHSAMLKNLFRKFSRKKDAVKSNIDCDSVPEAPRDNTAAPVPIPLRGHLYANHPLYEKIATSHSTERAQDSGPSSQDPALVLGGRSQSLETETAANRNHEIPQIAQSPLPSHTGASIQLSISHSHGFQIGNVQNVTVANGSVANFNSIGSGLSQLEKSLSCLNSEKSTSSNNLDRIENIYDIIKDWEISLISEYVSDDWKSLGDWLEFSDTKLQILEAENRGEPKKAVLEMLRTYLRTFPDTSVGFISSVLRQTGHWKAAEQLAKLH